MNKHILEIFIENFSQLYLEYTVAVPDSLVSEYLDKLQDIKTHVDQLNLNNGETKNWYESHLIGVLTRTNYYRAGYSQDTYQYTVFDSIFDLALETLNDFHHTV